MKLAVVTGSSSGIGLAVTNAFLNRGWNVVGISRRSPAEALVNYEHWPQDLTRLPEVVETLPGKLEGRIAEASRVVLVNNSGQVEPVALVSELPADGLDRAMTLNATTPLWLMGLFIRLCREKNRPLVVANISSGAAVNPYAGWLAYCSSKAALQMGMKVAAEEARRESSARPALALISYAPGVVDTPMQNVLRETEAGHFPDKARFVEMHEKGQLLPPEKPAEHLVGLIIDGASRDGGKLPLYSELRYG